MRGIPESEKMHFRCSEYTGSRVSESEFSSKLEDLDTPKKLRSTCPQDYTPGINDTSSEINLFHQSLSKSNFILPPYISVVKEKRILLPAPWLHLPSPFVWVLEKANLEKPTPTNHGQRRKYLPVLLGEMLVPTCVGRCWKAKNRLNLGHGHPWLKKKHEIMEGIPNTMIDHSPLNIYIYIRIIQQNTCIYIYTHNMYISIYRWIRKSKAKNYNTKLW